MIISELIDYGAKKFNLGYKDIISGRLHPHHAKARFAVYKALTLRGADEAQICKWTKRDTDRVRYGIRKADTIMAGDKDYARKVRGLAEAKMVKGKVVSPYDVLTFVSTLASRNPEKVLTTPNDPNYYRLFYVTVTALKRMGYSTRAIAEALGCSVGRAQRVSWKSTSRWQHCKIAEYLLAEVKKEFV